MTEILIANAYAVFYIPDILLSALHMLTQLILARNF